MCRDQHYCQIHRVRDVCHAAVNRSFEKFAAVRIDKMNCTAIATLYQIASQAKPQLGGILRCPYQGNTAGIKERAQALVFLCCAGLREGGDHEFFHCRSILAVWSNLTAKRYISGPARCHSSGWPSRRAWPGACGKCRSTTPSALPGRTREKCSPPGRGFQSETSSPWEI